jgi:hypothetical protein
MREMRFALIAESKLNKIINIGEGSYKKEQHPGFQRGPPP